MIQYIPQNIAFCFAKCQNHKALSSSFDCICICMCTQLLLLLLVIGGGRVRLDYLELFRFVFLLGIDNKKNHGYPQNSNCHLFGSKTPTSGILPRVLWLGTENGFCCWTLEEHRKIRFLSYSSHPSQVLVE